MKMHEYRNRLTIQGIIGILLFILPGFVNAQDHVIIAPKSEWRYLDDGTNPGGLWNKISFDDSSWDKGLGKFGYGEGDEGTVLSYGPDAANKYVSYLFRHRFNLSDPNLFRTLSIKLLRDDGAIVYINGKEVIRSNMPATSDLTTLAIDGIGDQDEFTYFPFVVKADMLVAGTNVIAVELHQNAVNSSDLGFDLEMTGSQAALVPVKINEVMASNASANLDPDYLQFGDWIELYNGGTEPYPIGGYYLTDDPDEPRMWQFPSGSSIPAGGFLVVYANGLNQNLYTNFQLSKSGEKIALFDTDGALVDTLTYPALSPNISYGSLSNGGAARGFFWSSSPGTSNSGGLTRKDPLPSPVFSKSAGFYSGSFNLEITSPDPLGVIRYTRDGSDPTPNSSRYTSAISVSSNSVVKARVFKDGSMPSTIVTNTYFINENIDIAVISIALNPDFLDDPDLGIYLNDRLDERREWERPATLEFFEPDGSRGFLSNVDLRLFGRSAVRFPQKSFGVFIRPTDGKDGLNYNLFPGTPYNFYQSFVLRSSSDDWRNTMFRDGFCQTLIQDHIDVIQQDYRPSIVFINGEFMGIHNIRDKINDMHFVTHEGVDPDNLDLIYVDNDYNPPVIEAKSGDEGAYWAMWNFITKNDMSVEQNYQIAGTMLDIDNYIDFNCVQILVANQSWRHNCKFWRPKNGDTRFRCVVWDMDYGYQFIDRNNLVEITANEPLVKALIKNPDFKNKFKARLDLLSQTVFTADRAVGIIDSMASVIEPYIQRHADRWKGTMSGVFATKAEWQARVKVMRDFAIARPARHETYFKNYFGTSTKKNFDVAISPANSGKVLVNGNLLTESSFNGNILANSQVSIQAIPNEGYQFANWRGFSSSSNTLFAMGSEWKYLDNGSNQGTAWRATGFDDSSWKSGNGAFGYGESSGITTTVSYGSDSQNKYVTTYFRKKITISNPSAITSLTIELLRDDGAVVYLNGTEVARANMPSGTITHTTLASSDIYSSIELNTESFSISPALLVSGSNVIAVELHQSLINSVDLRFDMSLKGSMSSTDTNPSKTFTASQDYALTAVFTTERENPVIITELNYGPPTTLGDDSEFIELFNTSTKRINISGYEFDGVDFTFPSNTFIDPGQYVLIAGDKDLYSYLTIPVFEWTVGDLSNSGENLLLKNSSGTLIDQVDFKAVAPWPTGIVGSGYTIELSGPGLDNNQGASWKKSGFQSGSPGATNPEFIYKDIKINEITAIPSKSGYLGEVNWLELVNAGTRSVNLAGFYLSNDPDNPVKYKIPVGFDSLTTIDPGEEIVFIAENTPETGPLHLPFKLKGEAGSVLLSALAGDRMIIIDRVDYAYAGKGTSYGRLPSATGTFTTLKVPTPARANHQTDLNILTAARIKPGDEVPLIVKITDANGEINRTANGEFQILVSHGVVEPDTIRIRNGMGSVMATFTATQDFEVSLRGYSYKRFVEVSNQIPLVTLASPITKPTTLAAGVDYLIRTNLEIQATGNLIVPEGTRLFVDSVKSIVSYGRVEFNGTADQPIIILPSNPRYGWGGLEVQNVDSLSVLNWILTGKAAAYPGKGRGHGLKQPVILGVKTNLSLDHVYITDCLGRAGYSEYSQMILKNCYAARCAIGYEFRYGHAEVYNTWLMEIPDNDWTVRLVDTDALYFWEFDDFTKPHIVENCVINRTEDDGIDMLTAPVIIRNTLFTGCYEKGISAGYRSRVEVDRSVFNGMYGGAQASFAGELLITNSTFYNITRPVFTVDASGTVINSILAKHKNLYDRDTLPSVSFENCISDSDPNLLGTGNIYGNPGLKDPAKFDYTLVSDSKAIDKGSPKTGLDPDGSLPDLGAYIFGTTTKENLVINEIHYHPSETQGNEASWEFVEIVNQSSRVLDLSGFRLSGPVEFTFPSGIKARPGEILLVASDRFYYQHLGCQIFSWDPGLLPNSSSTIRLISKNGVLVDEVGYADSSPWPAAADGLGYSLSLNSPALDNATASNWSASYVIGGTPGLENVAPDFTKLKINEYYVNAEVGQEGNPVEDCWVELYNLGHMPINVGGLYWTDDLTVPLKWMIPAVYPAQTTIEPGQCLLFTFAPSGSGDPLKIGIALGAQSRSLALYRKSGTQNFVIDQTQITYTTEPGSAGRFPNGSGAMRTFIYGTPGLINQLPAKYLITPRQMIAGERLPVVVRLDTLDNLEPLHETKNFDLEVSNGTLRSKSIKMVKGIGSLTTKIEAAGDRLKLGVSQFADTLGVQIRPTRHLVYINNALPFSGTWTSESDYWIPNSVEIEVGRKLTIMPGARILLGKNAKITVNGTLEVLGTPDNPVLFTSYSWGEPWGGISFGPLAMPSTITYAFFINGGGDSGAGTGHSKTQAVITSLGGKVTMNSAFLIDNIGKAVYSTGAQIVMNQCLISRCDAGVEGYGSRIEMDGSTVMFIPNESQSVSDTREYDAIYLSDKHSSFNEAAVIKNSVIAHVVDDGIDIMPNAHTLVQNSYLYKTLDKGIAIAQANANIAYSVIEQCDEGISAREGGSIRVDHTTFHKNTLSLRSNSTQPTVGKGNITLTNSILAESQSEDFSKEGDNVLAVSYSLTDKAAPSGTGNKQGSPGFNKVSVSDFTLSPSSPAIDAGDPSFANDPDGSRTDMGAFWFNQQGSSDLIINEIFYQTGASTLSEFIEITNKGSQPIDLNGYRFEQSVNHTFNQSLIIQPGEFLVITKKLSDYQGKGFKVVQWTSGELGNSGGTVTLIKPNGFTEDMVGYESGGSWPTWPINYFTSIELEGPGLNNSLPDSWRTSYYVGGTPGKENQIAPVEKVYLNEVLPRNTKSYPDETGQFSDWIELYNGSNHFINVAGLFLTKTKEAPLTFQISDQNLEATLIPPSGFLVFWLDEAPEKGIRHVSFLLPGAGSFVGISKQVAGGAAWLDSLTYPSLTADYSFGRSPDGSSNLVRFDLTSPAASNVPPKGRLSGIYINELMARNTLTVKNNLNEYDDWIELYNSNNESVDVGGLYLSDHKDNALLCRIPDSRPDSTTIPPRGFLVLYPTTKTWAGVRHLDFQLTGSGEYVYLSQVYNNQTYLMDSVTYPPILNDISYGRTRDGELPWIRFSSSTPARSNHGASGITDDELASRLMVYPNPAERTVYISIPGNIADMEYLRVVNSLGQVVKEWTGAQLKTRPPGPLVWNVEDQAFPVNGVYMVLLKGSKRMYSEKFFIHR